jgi:hypothetical protein
MGIRRSEEGDVVCRLSIKRILVHGTILSVLLSILIYGSLLVDPLMWVGDYPPDIQAAVGVVDVPLVRTLIAGALFLAVVVGVVLRSNAKLRQQCDGKLPFLTAFINSGLIFLFFATWDLLVLDWLVFVTIQPGFVVIPGTEGLSGYKDYWFHFQVSFLGWTQWISILVGSLVLAGLSMIRLGGRRRSEEQRASAYYVESKAKLLRKHNKLASAGREIAILRYGEAFADTLVRESLAEFEELIPELPYIGGEQNALTDNLVFSASALALYRVMKRHGRTVQETGEVLYRTVETWVRRYPCWLRRVMGWYYMSRFNQRRSRKKAAVSQERRYPGDWVREHVEGCDDTFDWGIDYTECGIVKFLRSQGADELAPYLCLNDYALFGALGIGLERTMTLAEGCKKCDFRFNKGTAARSGWPPSWLESEQEEERKP